MLQRSSTVIAYRLVDLRFEEYEGIQAREMMAEPIAKAC